MEIGGYLELERFAGREYHADLIALNTARNALLYVLKAKRIRKVHIPRYLCLSISELLDREGVLYDTYPVGSDFLPRFDKELREDECLYIVNYFGQINNQTILRLNQRYGRIIVDNVQAFFQLPLSGIDTLYSCRKFFGVPDGAYLSTDTLLCKALPVDVSMDRMRHLLGRLEGRSASEYYADFLANERALQELELRSMSKLTHDLLTGIDYAAVKHRREANYAFLHNCLGNRNALQLTSPVGPYAYPFYCENGTAIRESLAKQEIYIPTLWPNVLVLDDCIEKTYAENILPLPVDQRYEKNDLIRVVEEVIRHL